MPLPAEVHLVMIAPTGATEDGHLGLYRLYRDYKGLYRDDGKQHGNHYLGLGLWGF